MKLRLLTSNKEGYWRLRATNLLQPTVQRIETTVTKGTFVPKFVEVTGWTSVLRGYTRRWLVIKSLIPPTGA